MATATRSGNRRTGEPVGVRRLVSIALVSILIGAGFAFAYIHASVALSQAQTATRQAQAASRQAQKTADCVNAILGARAPLTNADHANERKKIEDQKAAELDKERGLTELSTAKDRAARIAGFRLYQKGVAEFVKALDDWIARDDVIAKAKAAHPLGAC